MCRRVEREERRNIINNDYNEVKGNCNGLVSPRRILHRMALKIIFRRKTSFLWKSKHFFIEDNF